MPNIRSLALDAQDELYKLTVAKILLDMAVNELEATPDSKDQRVEILLECYTERLDLHLDELRAYLVQIWEQAIAQDIG